MQKASQKYEHACAQIVGNKAKGRISKRVFEESKARENFRKTNILFFGNFGVLCFLQTPVLRFALLPYYLLQPGGFRSNLPTTSLLHSFEFRFNVIDVI